MVNEERYEFSSQAKKKLFTFLGVGILLTLISVFTYNLGNGGEHDHGENHVVAHTEVDVHSEDFHDNEPYVDTDDHHSTHEVHHGATGWLKRFIANFWINSVYFAGLGIVGIFFFAIQYVSQAGWSAGIKRIPFAYGSWLPVAFFMLLGGFILFGGDIFHWTHADLYVEGGDKIIQGKASYFFWPLEGGTTPVFFLARMILFFGVWYLCFRILRKYAFEEDLIGGTDYWFKMRRVSAIFVVFFAVSSSMSAWDWVLSIDTHWFSTMFGWYVFASWWVAGLALTLFLVINLKEKGYLAIVNENHVHDLGKFIFAFSIFWTYIWFSQFLLIYYANIPEETIYFMDRWRNPHYMPVFYINIILNFCLPFLILMTRDSKRYPRILKVICPIVVFGHWLDFYLMVMPGTLGNESSFGLLEIGLILVYLSSFLYVVFNTLSKAPLFAKKHPMLQESLNHHI